MMSSGEVACYGGGLLVALLAVERVLGFTFSVGGGATNTGVTASLTVGDTSID